MACRSRVNYPYDRERSFMPSSSLIDYKAINKQALAYAQTRDENGFAWIIEQLRDDHNQNKGTPVYALGLYLPDRMDLFTDEVFVLLIHLENHALTWEAREEAGWLLNTIDKIDAERSS